MKFITIFYFCLIASQAISAEIHTFFSPNGGCTSAIVQTISLSKESVRVQAYSFTSQKIADELIKAKLRNMIVEVIMDETAIKANGSVYEYLWRHGVKVWRDDRHAIAHNKIVIVDENIVITGSFNFSTSAETRNAENIVVIKDKKTAEKFTDNFVRHKNHSNLDGRN